MKNNLITYILTVHLLICHTSGLANEAQEIPLDQAIEELENQHEANEDRIDDLMDQANAHAEDAELAESYGEEPFPIEGGDDTYITGNEMADIMDDSEVDHLTKLAAEIERLEEQNEQIQAAINELTGPAI